MGDDYDPYNSQFTAEISKRMRVPDRLSIIGGSPTHGPTKGGEPDNFHQMMKVPDRILVAGNNSHIASKSTPRELQLENSVLPPTVEHVRVHTPPRSIRLDDHNFPTADAEEDRTSSTSSPYERPQPLMHRSSSFENENPAGLNTTRIDTSVVGLGNLPRENLTPWEELQLVRRQIAKLNHRLMAVELENQHQRQRETFLTGLVCVYFIGKFVMWLQRSL